MQPIQNKHDLIAFFENAQKPKSQWRIGAEHETFLYDTHTWQRVSAQQIENLLKKWANTEEELIYEDEHLIGVHCGNGAISLEPAGQFELSGAPHLRLTDVIEEITHHVEKLKKISASLDLLPLSLGVDPYTDIQHAPWLSKARYKIMRPYMLTKGSHGLEMMGNTCTVQVNLDYTNEGDMVRKFRVSLALQPLATALFANSPLTQGSLNGYTSYRRFIWHHTDSDRCGTPAFVFEKGMGYERYVDYALDVPMYFVKRQDKYINVAGASFKDFMAGRLEALPGQYPTLKDWEDHLSTIFTEVRLKKVLEMRGADSGPLPHLCALPAFWTGLLYDDNALGACEMLIQDWSAQDIFQASMDVPMQGLDTLIHSRSFWSIAQEIIGYAYQGLKNQQEIEDHINPLNYLNEIIKTGKTQADHVKEIWRQYPDKKDFLMHMADV